MGNTPSYDTEDQIDVSNEQTIFQNLLGSSTQHSRSFFSVNKEPDWEDYAVTYGKTLAPVDVQLEKFSVDDIATALRTYLVPSESGETIEDSLAELFQDHVDRHFFVFNLDICNMTSIEELSTFFIQLSDMKQAIAGYPAKFAFNIQISSSIKSLLKGLNNVLSDRTFSIS